MSEAGRSGRSPLSISMKRSNALPGLWGSILTALLSAAACWFVVAPELAASDFARLGTHTSRLEELQASDMANALPTLSGSAGVLDRARRRECQALAVVTLVASPGNPPAKVRLRSGTYDSPPLTLTTVPMRIAIPYPAPFSVGHGILSVFSDGGQAVVALYPPRVLPVSPGLSSIPVSWRPHTSCEAPGD